MNVHALSVAAAALAAISAAPVVAQSSPSNFTTGIRYDAERRITGTISPDPDGAGPLHYAATRSTFDAAGRLIRIEAGELSAWQSEAVAPASWAGFTVFRQTETEYDTVDRKVVERVSAVSGSVATAKALTQYAYDAVGRLECTAVRMNAAAFGSLPSSACALGTEGSDGPDRITKNVYDAAGQVLQVRKAVGTGVESADVTYSYTLNGKPQDVIDANGNHAQFVYDGFDRQLQWVFPSTTAASAYNDATPSSALASANALNSGDYEQYGYDANGNRTSFRRRDGRVFTLSYDALDRNTSKVLTTTGCALSCTAAPSSALRSVYYGYDLQGHRLFARFDSASGADGVIDTYNGLGEPLSSTTVMSGMSRTIGYQWDADRMRSRVTHPDGQYVNMYREGLGRLFYADLNSATPLFYPPYDDRGRVAALYRLVAGNWAIPTSYGYDGIDRLTSLTHDLVGTSADVTTTFAYNPASQITSEARSNDGYAWAGSVNVDRNYAVNGLNQYASAGSASFTYDANGNLTSDGLSSFVYDAENRLVGASGAKTASLTYDPLGRLWQVAGTGATTRFLYDGDELIAEYDTSGTLLRRYVHSDAADDPLVWYEGSGTASPRYIHTNHQGSVVAVADTSGNLLAINSYDEYGIPGATNVGRFQYTGQSWLPELGMYYYKARIYSPTLGRFMQTDPIGYKDQQNLYAYVANDPVNNRDPDGKQVAAAAPLLCAGPQAVGCAAVAVGVTAVAACAASESCRGAVSSAAQAIGNGIRNLVTPQSSERSNSRTDGAATTDKKQNNPITVYRLSGGLAGPLGRSWTPVDPRILTNPRDSLGLPNGNTATTLSTGLLVNQQGVIAQPATPLDGNRGGAPELVVPNPAGQIQGITQQPFIEPRLR